MPESAPAPAAPVEPHDGFHQLLGADAPVERSSSPPPARGGSPRLVSSPPRARDRSPLPGAATAAMSPSPAKAATQTFLGRPVSLPLSAGEQVRLKQQTAAVLAAVDRLPGDPDPVQVRTRQVGAVVA